MKPEDPRRALAFGCLAILAAGYAARALFGVTPAVGWRVNQALDAMTAAPSPAAAEFLERVARERPDDSAAWVRAGRARAALGDATAAADLIEVAVNREPSSSTTRYELAKALSSGWLNEEAEAVLAPMMQAKPRHADGQYLFAALAAARGDAKAAADRFETAVAAGASDPDHYREDPRFDPVRADPRFLRRVRELRNPEAFEASVP